MNTSINCDSSKKYSNIDINKLRKLQGIEIGNGRSGYVMKIADNIVKKVYTNNAINRMKKETDVLSLLQNYPYFPKIIFIDYDNSSLYMSYVGIKLRGIKKQFLPSNSMQQVYDIVQILKDNNIFHHDLALSHLMLHNNIIHLVDFEKACINKCCLKKSDTIKYKYDSMDYLYNIFDKYYNKHNIR